MTRSFSPHLATLGSLALMGASLVSATPAQAYWHGYRCWGGCWERPVVVPGPVVRPVVVAPPVTITPAAPVVTAVASAQICAAPQAVSLRTGPNQNFAPIATLTLGTPVAVIRNQVNAIGQDWSLINAAGYQGFVPTGHICYVNP